MMDVKLPGWIIFLVVEVVQKRRVLNIGVNIGEMITETAWTVSLSGVAYLDGIPDEATGVRTSNPSLIISRGIYHNWQVWALDLKGNKLETRWKFDTAEHSSKWLSMCSHSFRVADLDDDGKR